MKLCKRLAIVWLALPFAAGFTSDDLKTYPAGRADTQIVDEAVARGATTCRYNLEDLIVHALGDRDRDGFTTYPIGAEANRPSAGIYVTKYPNGDESHLQWVVGPDASGYCTLYWTESRHWKQTCAKVLARYEGDEWGTPQSLGGSTLLVGRQEKGNGLRVVATPVDSGCMVTESDLAWRIDPDEKAREWIKADHGYDPDDRSSDVGAAK